MIDLVRALLERPVDPRLARVVVILAITITFTFAVLVTFGVIAGSVPSKADDRGGRSVGGASAPSATRPELAVEPAPDEAGGRPPAARARPRQDPQDRPGTRDYRRARREMREHRALQHLPFRRGDLSIDLVGADRGRAVIRIDAPTLAGARRGWRSFLHRFHDDGRSYRVKISTARVRHG